MLSPRTTTRGRATAGPGAGAAGAGSTPDADGAAATAGAGFAAGAPALEPPMPAGTAAEASPPAGGRRRPSGGTNELTAWLFGRSLPSVSFSSSRGTRELSCGPRPGLPEAEPHLHPPSGHVDPFHFLIRLVEGVGHVDVGLRPAEATPDPQGGDPVVAAIRPLRVGDVRAQVDPVPGGRPGQRDGTRGVVQDVLRQERQGRGVGVLPGVADAPEGRTGPARQPQLDAPGRHVA